MPDKFDFEISPLFVASCRVAMNTSCNNNRVVWQSKHQAWTLHEMFTNCGETAALKINHAVKKENSWIQIFHHNQQMAPAPHMVYDSLAIHDSILEQSCDTSSSYPPRRHNTCSRIEFLSFACPRVQTMQDKMVHACSSSGWWHHWLCHFFHHAFCYFECSGETSFLPSQ